MNTTITLDYPYAVDGVTLSAITLRRPTVADNLAVQKSNAADHEREIRLLANLAELAPENLHSMDLKDYAKLQKAFTSFLS